VISQELFMDEHSMPIGFHFQWVYREWRDKTEQPA